MSTKAWEKLPTETSRAYQAFIKYLEMPLYDPDPEKTRSLNNLSKTMGKNSMASAQKWSRMNNWVERAEEYDAHVGEQMLTIRSSTLAEYQQNVVQSMTSQLVVADNIINQILKRLHDAVLAGDDVNTMDVQRMLGALRIKDDLARRTANMPTTFRSEEGDDMEEVTYIIGGTTDGA